MNQAVSARSISAHVVVLGNEKGGSGKSTTAMHVAVALMKAGQRVATIDLDSRQKSFTHYIENRRTWAQHPRIHPRVSKARCHLRAPWRLCPSSMQIVSLPTRCPGDP